MDNPAGDTAKRYAEEIQKTGFVLEYQVGRSLQKKGWSVISNKYYLDDTEERVREIDLVAYKVSRQASLSVYTALIISCKKSASHDWCLLARKLNPKDPNVDWTPIHSWTNDKILQYECSLPQFAKSLHEHASKAGASEVLRPPAMDIFAFQEMNRAKGTPQNDAAIFGAITSLMKAQAYELQALPQRKKAACIYQFNLLSIFDGELIRLDFDGARITPAPVNSEHYIARYIVQKKETFARVHFIRSSHLEDILDGYDRLHFANSEFFKAQVETFYVNAISDENRRAVLTKDLLDIIRWKIRSATKAHIGKELSGDDIWMGWNKATQTLCFSLFEGSEEGAAALNQDTGLAAEIRKALKKVYRYEGKFRFEYDDIPF